MHKENRETLQTVLSSCLSEHLYTPHTYTVYKVLLCTMYRVLQSLQDSRMGCLSLCLGQGKVRGEETAPLTFPGPGRALGNALDCPVDVHNR